MTVLIAILTTWSNKMAMLLCLCVVFLLAQAANCPPEGLNAGFPLPDTGTGQGSLVFPSCSRDSAFFFFTSAPDVLSRSEEQVLWSPNSESGECACPHFTAEADWEFKEELALLFAGYFCYMSNDLWVVCALCVALFAGFCIGRAKKCESSRLELRSPCQSEAHSPFSSVHSLSLTDGFLLDSEFELLKEVLNDGNYKRQFTFERQLGEGGFGSVELAQHKLENESYAVKMVRMKMGVHQEIHSHKFFSEVTTLMQMQSKYIVRYHTCWVERESESRSLDQSVTSFASELSVEGNYMEVVLYIQMEYCDGKTLADWLHHRQSVSPAANYRVVYQILKGVDYIHRKHVIHRDLKPTNIFVNNEDDVKIGDFNLATALASEHSLSTKLSTNVGSPFYLAPEQEKSSEYNDKVDLYSVGVILVELFSLYDTAHERSKELTLMRKTQRVPEAFTKAHPAPAQLAQWLVNEDPSARPSASEVLACKLFRDWGRVIS